MTVLERQLAGISMKIKMADSEKIPAAVSFFLWILLLGDKEVGLEEEGQVQIEEISSLEKPKVEKYSSRLKVDKDFLECIFECLLYVFRYEGIIDIDKSNANSVTIYLFRIRNRTDVLDRVGDFTSEWQEKTENYADIRTTTSGNHILNQVGYALKKNPEQTDFVVKSQKNYEEFIGVMLGLQASKHINIDINLYRKLPLGMPLLIEFRGRGRFLRQIQSEQRIVPKGLPPDGEYKTISHQYGLAYLQKKVYYYGKEVCELNDFENDIFWHILSYSMNPNKRVISFEELIEKVRYGSENKKYTAGVMTKNISTLRRTLRNPKFPEIIPRKTKAGYFINTIFLEPYRKPYRQ